MKIWVGWIKVQDPTVGFPSAQPNLPTDRLEASWQTPPNCHRTRLIYMAIALPAYPALYTYVALFPESSLARHIQPSELIPQQIQWRQAPETWWRLVEEVSVLAFTQPQWNFTPAVGQRVGVDRECTLPVQ